MDTERLQIQLSSTGPDCWRITDLSADKNENIKTAVNGREIVDWMQITTWLLRLLMFECLLPNNYIPISSESISIKSSMNLKSVKC